MTQQRIIAASFLVLGAGYVAVGFYSGLADPHGDPFGLIVFGGAGIILLIAGAVGCYRADLRWNLTKTMVALGLIQLAIRAPFGADMLWGGILLLSMAPPAGAIMDLLAALRHRPPASGRAPSSSAYPTRSRPLR